MLIKLNNFEYQILLIDIMSNNLLLNTIDNLAVDVIISKILKQLFPFDLAFFLTSTKMYDLLDQYYEQFGIIDIQSKNFIRALSNFAKNTTFKKLSQDDSFDNLGYDIGTIPFTDTTTTIKMNHHLESFINTAIIKIKKYHEKMNIVNSYGNRVVIKINNVKTQIMFLTAISAIEQRFGIKPNTIDKCIPVTHYHHNTVKKEFVHFRDYFISELLYHDTNKLFKIYTPYIPNICNESNIRNSIYPTHFGAELCCYEHMIETIEISVNIVNVFYAMIGVNRVYKIPYDKTTHYDCSRCGRNMNKVINMCSHEYGSTEECNYTFYVIPTNNEKTENYFECPDVHNDIYSKIKCTKRELEPENSQL